MEPIDLWYFKEVYLWRNVASITWYMVFLPVLIILYALTAQVDFLHPLTWIGNTVWGMCSMYFLITVAVIMLADGILAWYSVSTYTVHPEVADTRFQKLMWMSRPSRLLHMTVYIGVSFFVSWCACMYAGERFSRFVIYSLEQRDVVYLNEAHVVFMLYGMYTGLYKSWQFYLCQLNCLHFPVIQREKFFLVRGRLPSLFVECSFQTLHQLKYFYLLYFFLGHIPRRWMLYYLNLMLSPNSQPIDTVWGLLDVGLAWQLFLLGIFLNYSWNLSILLYTAYHTEKYEFPIESAFDSHKNKTLMEAISCVGKPLLQYLGYYDLYHLSRMSPVRRREVFALSKPGGHPHTWNKLSTVCLTDIDVLNNQVQDYNWRTVAAVAQRPGPMTDTIGTDVNGTVPRYRGSTTTPANTFVTGTSEVKPVAAPLWKEKVMSFLAHKPVLSYFFSPIPDAKSRQLFSKCQKQVWGIDALSHLVASSFKEDSYGVVQRSLPLIMSSLLNLHENVEKHFKLCTSPHRRSQREPPLPHDAALRYQLQSTLKTAIYRIVNVFGKHMMDVPLTPECKKKLIPFVEFRE